MGAEQQIRPVAHRLAHQARKAHGTLDLFLSRLPRIEHRVAARGSNLRAVKPCFTYSAARAAERSAS